MRHWIIKANADIWAADLSLLLDGGVNDFSVCSFPIPGQSRAAVGAIRAGDSVALYQSGSRFKGLIGVGQFTRTGAHSARGFNEDFVVNPLLADREWLFLPSKIRPPKNAVSRRQMADDPTLSQCELFRRASQYPGPYQLSDAEWDRIEELGLKAIDINPAIAFFETRHDLYVVRPVGTRVHVERYIDRVAPPTITRFRSEAEAIFELKRAAHVRGAQVNDWPPPQDSSG